MDCCIPVSDVASRRHLRSARRHHLVVRRHSLSSYGRRAFAVAGPAAWNSLSDDLRDPTLSTESFRCLLKTHILFSEYIQRIRGITLYALYKFTTYLLTYLLTYNKLENWHSEECKLTPTLTIDLLTSNKMGDRALSCTIHLPYIPWKSVWILTLIRVQEPGPG